MMAAKGMQKQEKVVKCRGLGLLLLVSVVVLLPSGVVLQAGAQTQPPPQPSQQEVSALVAIKAAFGNPSTLASWNDTGALACSTWVGITCSSTGQVIFLTLPGRRLTGPLAEDIGNLTSLRKISLHDNAITGSIPQSLGTLPAMRGIALFSNQFSGNIPANLGNSSALQALDLSFNQLNGLIPPILTQSSRLYFVDFSYNSLWGGFPYDWILSQSLTDIILSGNYLSGSLPNQWGNLNASAPVIGKPPLQLQQIDLGDNYFSGIIPSTLGALGNLTVLRLGHNQFVSQIPNELTLLTLLQSLDLSDNQLNGSIPAQLGDLRSLNYLDLENNSLSGPIPTGLGETNLSTLLLGANHLTGSIPSDLGNLTQLSSLNFTGNNLTGPLPASIGNLTKLNTLSLSENDLTGSIPTEYGDLVNLFSLDFSHNDLSGDIPTQFGKLTLLSSLDLDYNNLSGDIPVSLIGLFNLTSLNVSYNNLRGPIPPFRQNFNDSAFLGNPGICGRPPFIICPVTAPPTPTPAPGASAAASGGHHHKLSTISIVFIALGSALAALALICLCLLVLWKRKDDSKNRALGGGAGGATPEKNGDPNVDSEEMGGKLVHFDGPMAFSADHLLCATAEVLGKSAYGTVYKATLEDGNIIAVKRLREGIVKGQKEFESEVGTLGKIRHPNLLALRAYYWGPKDEKLLVFDYMASGSLAAFLHARGPETPLNWETRMIIAMGAARGLGFLHENENIVHGNLTASNILLDGRMNSKISDYGLSRLMTPQAMQGLMASAGTLGYRAPELSKTKKASAKADVYSFGIVLLELLTGKAPVEQSSSESGMDLAEWVNSVVKEEWTSEVFDKELINNAPHHQEEEMYNTLQLAMVCVNTAPTSRPEMEDVVRQLEEIRPDLRSSPESANSTSNSGTEARKE